MSRLAMSALTALIALISLLLLRQATAEERRITSHRALRVHGRRQVLATEDTPPVPSPTPSPTQPNVRAPSPSKKPSAKSPPPPRSPPKPVKPRSTPRPSPTSPQPPPSPPPPWSPSTPSQPPAATGHNLRDGEAVDSHDSGSCPDVDALLNRTNIYRLRHQAPALTWSASLATASAAYAQVLADNGCTLKHSAGRDYGENLMMMQGYPKPDATCTVAAKGWYSEVRDYDFDAAQPFYDNWPRGTGHFSQLVWRGTLSMGCGVGLADVALPIVGGRTLAGGCKVIVCRYRAPGNVASDMAFLKNVLRNTTAAVV